MDFHYVDTPEIKVSIGMTTGQIKQIINFLEDHNTAISCKADGIKGGFDEHILMSHIMRLKAIYESAMINIESYAQGQQTNV